MKTGIDLSQRGCLTRARNRAMDQYEQEMRAGNYRRAVWRRSQVRAHSARLRELASA